MHASWFAAASSLVLLTFVSVPARAEILECDARDKSSYELAGHSKKHKQLAFRRTLGVCDSSEGDANAMKGYHQFQTVEVYKYGGDLKRKFFWSGKPEVAKRTAEGKLPEALRSALDGALTRGKIESYLESGKFDAVEASRKSHNEECSLKIEWGPEDMDSGVVPERAGKVFAVHGKKKTLVHEVKTSARDLEVKAYWYAKGKLAAVVTQRKVWHPGSGHCCDYEKLVFARVPAACY